MSQDPVTNIQGQLNAMRRDLDDLEADTMGDRNKIEAFKRTLHGRIERLEEITEVLEGYTEIRTIVKKNDSTLNRVITITNWAIGIFVGGIIAALATLVAARLFGGG